MRLRLVTITALGIAAIASYTHATAPTRALRVDPARLELGLGERRQLQARGVPSRKPVRWRVVNGVGSISEHGVYEAPPRATTPAAAVVRAESEDGAAGEARVLIPAVRVRAWSERQDLQLGEACRLQATVEGAEDPRVTWSVDGGSAHGEVSEAGLYATPDQHPTPATLVVRATSVADPSKSAAVPLRLKPVTIEVRPRETRMRMGETRRFEAEVRGARRAGVRWSVVGEGRGSVTPSGLYTPPETLGTPTVVTLQATSEADPTKTAQARITIAEVGLSITPLGVPRARRQSGPRLSATVYRVVRLSLPLDPLDSLVRFPLFRGRSGKIYVPLGGAYQFRARGDGAEDDIRWSLEGGSAYGTVTSDGLYLAPDRLLTPQVVRVVAQSAFDPGRRAVATLHIPPVLVAAKQRQVTAPLGGSAHLAAEVHNAENDRLRWEVEGGPSRGSVNEAGLFRPAEPLATPNTILVRAVSEADETKTAVIEVKVPEISVRVSPDTATVKAGATLRLRADVRGAANDTVRWRLDPPLGTITPAGTYTAPAGLTHEAQVEITAASAADPTKSSRSVIRLLPRRP